jgi:hypothetical protein
MTRDESTPERVNLYYQATSMGLYHGVFSSPIEGRSAFKTILSAMSLTTTLFLGFRLDNHAQLYLIRRSLAARDSVELTESPMHQMAKCRDQGRKFPSDNTVGYNSQHPTFLSPNATVTFTPAEIHFSEFLIAGLR